ncbi:MAG: GPR endopeptidase [Coprococcus sp.]
MNRNIRTDLAIELRENYEHDSKIEGVKIKTILNDDKSIRTTIIDVVNETGASNLGKDIGTYITIECESLNEYDEGIHEPLMKELTSRIKSLLGDARSVLVAGLGNRSVTPDSLGPLVIDNLYVTRHLTESSEKEDGLNNKIVVSAICPGVMAQTGIETVEILKGICHKIDVDTLIVIDALAARSSKRLNKTIQLTDTGISPGSGVGNNRKAITSKNMGIQVIAIGVPTVISVPSLVDDSMDIIADAFNQNYGKSIMKEFTDEQRYHLACSLVEPELVDMFVTPKNIDELVKRISFTISEAINSINQK